MTNRRKVEDKIEKKLQEIQELEVRIREARAYVQALQDVARLLPREGETTKDESSSARSSESMRSGSLVSDARHAILAAGKPLHVVDILKASGRDNTRQNRTGMSGSLAAYVRRNEIFTRPRPNTFGLLELRDRVPPKPTAPPENFGLDDDADDDHDSETTAH